LIAQVPVTEISHINSISDQQKEAIMSTSARKLPNRPSEQGFSADDIKRTLYEPISDTIDGVNGVVQTLNAKKNESIPTINANFKALFDNCDILNAFIQSAVETMLSDCVYPVGCIYTSFNATLPAFLPNYNVTGAWSKIEGRFLVAASGSTLSGVLGGSADAVVVAHTHTIPALSGNHSHTVIIYNATGKGYAGAWQIDAGHDNNTYTGGYTGGTGGHNHTVDSSGVSGTNKNMPPYITVYMWQRLQ
jgi:hypothetical protein